MVCNHFAKMKSLIESIGMDQVETGLYPDGFVGALFFCIEHFKNSGLTTHEINKINFTINIIDFLNLQIEYVDL
ncbi:hypothetical protein DL346_08880 [Paenibacillus montanisoli]|uniref:Uncharacterized protein n=1 Tax=Paenibacillus montanisoli TaxID=2081970 RepID=A0A328U722_9BACL|nr:hypothetical protein DL346_08880 [Paenibacillus montanisoli]